ncbi:hypothetical protein SAMN05880582_101808 [Rhizobium sp. RU20A]|uniref:tetratricopeptide repeat protein n=1 Tax=Rhizobium sp. RU20A TaxID=1907412 RepID=UPI000954DD7E|nr:hypothetical protein [Rhizobium sp. RU20A]SIQ11909.1 hypothetical protein SAMN05880582_101808 [Rhizobium sp. RU20A]
MNDASTQMLPRVALLPPARTKGCDSTLHRIACALVEDVTVELCQERAFVIVSPYTAYRLRGDAGKVEFLRRHRVSYALDARLSDGTLVVNLIFFPLDELIWAARLPLAADRLLEGRQKLIADICLNVTKHIMRSQTISGFYALCGDAYQNYLLGNQQLLKISLPATRKARHFFEKALSEHATFAPALSGIARTLYLEWLLTARGDARLIEASDAYARRAIAADPLQSSGYREFGMTQIYLGDIDQSVEALAHAESLSPHHADGLYSYGDTLVHASRPADALVKLDSALEHSPIAPDCYLWSAAGANYFLGRYEETLALVSRMKDQAPGDRIAAAAHAMLGQQDEAHARVRRVMEATPDFDVMNWLSLIVFKDRAQVEHYREGLLKAGFRTP